MRFLTALAVSVLALLFVPTLASAQIAGPQRAAVPGLEGAEPGA